MIITSFQGLRQLSSVLSIYFTNFLYAYSVFDNSAELRSNSQLFSDIWPQDTTVLKGITTFNNSRLKVVKKFLGEHSLASKGIGI